MLMETGQFFFMAIISTHCFAANIHIYNIFGGFSGTLFHTDEAVFLIAGTVRPVPTLQEKRTH